MTVVIVQQGDFLQYLLEPYLLDKNIRIEYSRGHHNDVAAAAEHGNIDVAMTHTKVKQMQKLAAAETLLDGRAIFANPKAFLGRPGDPANINGLTDATMAMQSLLERGYCYVVNPHGEMENLQQELLDAAASQSSCVMYDAKDTSDALHIADQNNAYTMWGLHPYLAKGDGKLEPVVIADDRLLQNLGVWLVQGSSVQSEAQALINYLASDAVKSRIAAFRFDGQARLQPWWPAVNSKITD